MLTQLIPFLQPWSATTSQPVTHWPKCFREYQEVGHALLLSHMNKCEEWTPVRSSSWQHVCSRTGPHSRRAPLRHLAVHPCLHAAALTLSKHRETREGKTENRRALTYLYIFFYCYDQLFCENDPHLTRCPSCRWCWRSSSSSSPSSEQQLSEPKCKFCAEQNPFRALKRSHIHAACVFLVFFMTGCLV